MEQAGRTLGSEDFRPRAAAQHPGMLQGHNFQSCRSMGNAAKRGKGAVAIRLVLAFEAS